jgi:hypothetical protein
MLVQGAKAMPPSRNNAVQTVIRYLFDPAQQAQAMQRLVDGCGRELASERIRLSVLKLSNGDLEELRGAIAAARGDWRDVLVWAGFGDSGTAHAKWVQCVRKTASLTAADWESCADPLLMLTALHGRADIRKLRLFAAGCARRALPWMGEVKSAWQARVRNALEVLDQFLNGEATHEELKGADFPRSGRFRSFSGFSWWWHTDEAALAVGQAIWACFQEGASSEATVLTVAEQALQRGVPRQRAAERATQAVLLRCLVGNPFRPLATRTFPTHVAGLVESIAAAFPEVSADYAILADALEEQGEGTAATHCRQETHARGCHVVDWILRRS